jgi:hypothetical protein
LRLSAALFRLAAKLSVAEIWSTRARACRVGGWVCLVLAAGGVHARRVTGKKAVPGASCAVIGKAGFPGVPMPTVLPGLLRMVSAMGLAVFFPVVARVPDCSAAGR